MSTSVADGTLFTDPARYADDEEWHAAVTTMRLHEPVCRVAVEGFPEFWAITRHSDINEIERSPEIFKQTSRVELQSLEAARVAAESGTSPETLLYMDDSKHRKYRDLTSDWFKPAALRRSMGDAVVSLAQHYVDQMVDYGGTCDFASDVARYYPLRVIMSMLGVPQQDEALMLALTQRIFGPSDPEYVITGDAAEDRAQSIREIFGYFSSLAAARRARPTDDLATVIANGTIDGEPLGDMHTLSYYLVLATAGHDTTSATIAAGLEALIRNPEQLRRLQREPDLIPNAAEEMLRWATPVKQFTRTPNADYQLRGQTLAAGDLVLLSFSSGNRDEEVFGEPFDFDVARGNANRNLAFGSGPHFCLGAGLARMQLSAFFAELLSRLDSFELAGPVERTHGITNSGIKHLPIRYAVTDRRGSRRG
jgi:cytochrome P450